ncbi:MAG: hypothetical protein J6A23_14970 [Thermoguttaceae bacterium]|nr:hypothetical protein [Thermoguttaceae bacterium]
MGNFEAMFFQIAKKGVRKGADTDSFLSTSGSISASFYGKEMKSQGIPGGNLRNFGKS